MFDDFVTESSNDEHISISSIEDYIESHERSYLIRDYGKCSSELYVFFLTAVLFNTLK